MSNKEDKSIPIPNEDCPTDYDDGTIPPQYKNVVEDPEDNDGEVKGLKDEEKSDPFMTTISIAKNILGSGILNFPVSYRQTCSLEIFKRSANSSFVSPRYFQTIFKFSLKMCIVLPFSVLLYDSFCHHHNTGIAPIL